MTRLETEPRNPAEGGSDVARLVWIDVLRGAAVFLVIATHAIDAVIQRTGDAPQALIFIGDALAPFRIPTLMFLSGLLLPRSLSKPARVFFTGKLRAIGWPFLVWTVVILAATGKLSLKRLLVNVVTPETVLWYLWFLLAAYVVVWLLDVWRVPLALPIAAFAVLAALDVDLYRFSRFFYLLLFFVAGLLVVRHQMRVSAWTRSRRVIAVAATLAVATAALSAAGVEVRYQLAFAPGVMAGVMAFAALARRVAGRAARVLQALGRDSLVFYVTHWPVLWLSVGGVVLAGTGPWLAWCLGITGALAIGALAATCRRRNRWVDALFTPPRVRRRVAD
ncbi:acyltransferase family protein [Cellulomonas sp. NPDC057328]|uniref:acyltransferase family protein n=1 Tax=Cellulomonas sp. NPDC057328 TaxID=3346101 RepID=UPI00363ACA65